MNSRHIASLLTILAVAGLAVVLSHSAVADQPPVSIRIVTPRDGDVLAVNQPVTVRGVTIGGAAPGTMVLQAMAFDHIVTIAEGGQHNEISGTWTPDSPGHWTIICASRVMGGGNATINVEVQ